MQENIYTGIENEAEAAERGPKPRWPFARYRYDRKADRPSREFDRQVVEDTVDHGEADDKNLGASNDSLTIYLKAIRRFPLLGAEEERVLAERAAKGDTEAKRRMIEANLRLVVNIAKHYMNRDHLHDIIEEGNIGLMKAVERFKTSKECRFSTYATYWIKQTIERALASKGNTVRLPIHVAADLSKVSRATRELSMQLNREPNAEEVAEKTDFSGRYVKKLDVLSKKVYSLDAALPDEEDFSLLDKIEDVRNPDPVDSIQYARRDEKVMRLLSRLNENEREVIRLRFGFHDDEPATLDAIGKSFGVTRERVRQIEARALDKLKRYAKQANIRSIEAVL